MKSLSLRQLRIIMLVVCGLCLLVSVGIFIIIGKALNDGLGVVFIIIALGAMFAALLAVDPRQ